MNCTLLIGPAGSGKTTRCLEQAAAWLEAHPAHPGVVFLVPSSGYAEEVKRRLAALQGGAVLGVTCLRFRQAALEILRRHKPSIRELSSARAALEADAVAAAEDFSMLRQVAGLPSTGESLAAFFTVARRYQVTPQDLLAMADRARSARADELARAYGTYLRRVASLLDPAEAPALAADLVRQGAALPFPCSLLIVDGFYDFTPVEEALLRALAERAERTICTLPYDPSRASLFASAGRTRERLLSWGMVEESTGAPHRTTPVSLAALERALFSGATQPCADSAVTFAEAASKRAEIELVAAEIARLTVEEQVGYDDIAVVFRDVQGYASLLPQVFAAYRIPFAFGEDLSLAATGPARHLSELVAYCAAGDDAEPPQSLLESCYGDRLTAEQLAVQRRALRERLAAARTSEQACQAVEAALRDSGAFRKIVSDAAPSESPTLAAGDLRALEAALETLAEVADWLLSTGAWSLESLARHLPRALAAAACPSPHRRGSGVQVLSVHEARTRSFPIVFLCGLAHGSFPLVTGEDAFLDEQARRVLLSQGRRLPPARPSLEEERLLFYLAATRAQRRLYLTRPSLDERGRPLIPSPFWEEARVCLGAEEAEVPLRRGLQDLVPPPDRVVATAEARIAIAAAAMAEGDRPASGALALLSAAPPEWRRPLAEARRTPEVGTERLSTAKHLALAERAALSASTLERYAACPFQCFCEQILGLAEAEGAQATVGLVLHEVLSRFFANSDWDGSEETATQASETLRQIAEQVIAEKGYFAAPDYESRYSRARTLAILSRFIATELDLRREREGLPYRHEVIFDQGPGAALDCLAIPNDPGPPILLRGRIDRVDVLSRGGRRLCVVVDYKTRKNSALTVRNIEDGYSLQLPLYMMALRQSGAEDFGEPVMAEWYCLEDGARVRMWFDEAEARQALRAPPRGRTTPVDPEGVVEHVTSYVRRLAEGDIRVEPHPEGICSWCAFGDVCRIAERRGVLLETEEE